MQKDSQHIYTEDVENTSAEIPVKEILFPSLGIIVLGSIALGVFLYKDVLVQYLNPQNSENVEVASEVVHLSLTSEDGKKGLYTFDLENDTLFEKIVPNTTTAYSSDMSPDGKKIAYSMEGVGGDSQIYVSDVFSDGSLGTPQKITNTDGIKSNPSWAPDGIHIAYDVVVEGDATTPESHSVFIVSTASGNNAYIEPGSYPIWNAEGTHLLYLRNDGIYFLRLGSFSSHRLWPGEGYSMDNDMLFSLSPDDTMLAIADPVNGELVLRSIISWDTGENTPIRGVEVEAYAPVFAPDGNRIAFQIKDKDTGISTLAIYNIEENKVKEVFDFAGYDTDSFLIDGWTGSYESAEDLVSIDFLSRFVPFVYAEGPGGGGGSVCPCGETGRGACRSCGDDDDPYVFTIDLFVDEEEAPEEDPHTDEEPADYDVHWVSNDTSQVDNQRPYCAGTGDWSFGSEQVNKSGRVEYTDIAEGSYEYFISCTYLGQSANSSAYVEIAEGTPTPTVNLDIREIGGSTWTDSVSVDLGEEVELSWSTTDATRCVGDTYFSTADVASGTQQTVGEPTSGMRTYTATCYNGPSGSDPSSADTVTVNVLASAPAISASPGLVNSGATSTISWTLNGHSECAISATNSDSIGSDPLTTDSSADTSAMFGEVTYTITCDDTGASDTTKVRIRPTFENI